MSIISAATSKLLALSTIKGIGPATLRRLAGAADFSTATPEQLSQLFPSIATMLLDVQVWSGALAEVEKQVENAERYSARILSALDQDYPQLLAATKDDPFLLFVRGTLAPDPARSVAVIGTREPTAHGVIIAERITQYFVEQNWSVVSGLAKGCDAIAHKVALQQGGHTIAVMAHGLHTIAPKSNQNLAEAILDRGGALVTEYRFGVDPRPEFFVKRDRIQAGLAQGVVMIQSDHKGGSLHASRATLDYGRWLAVPYPTELDRLNREPKCQANLTIAEGSEASRTELLRCAPAALGRIVVLKSRADYQAMISSTSPPSVARSPVQAGLL